MDRNRTGVMVEAGLTIALAYVLGRFMIYALPNGGAVSLEMLPILVFAYRRGLAAGVFAGAIYGLLNYTIHPVGVVHWIQFALDYSVAYGLLGLAGIGAGRPGRSDASDRTVLRMRAALTPVLLLAMSARFAAHLVSGIVFFGAYAPPGQPVFLYSLIYNSTYMIPAMILCMIAAYLVMPTLQKAVPVR